MEFITKRISKKVLAMVLTIAVLFTSVSASLFAFADLTEPYEVTLEEPAIPMTESTAVYFSALNVEMIDGDAVVSGADLTWSTTETEGIAIDNDKKFIAAFKSGVYPVTVSDGTNSVTLYVVVKTAEEEKWTLYSADFNNEEWNPAAGTSKALPEGWTYQIGGQKIGLTTVLQQTTAVPHSNVEGIPSDANGILVTGNAPVVSASGKILNDTASVFFTLNNTYVNDFKNYTVNANMLAYVDSIAGKLTDRNGTMGVGFFVRAQGADADGKFTVGGKSSFDTDIFAVNVNPDVDLGGYAGYAKFEKFIRAKNATTQTNIYPWTVVDKCSAESGVIMPASIDLSLKLDGTAATFSEAAGDFSTFENVTLPDRKGLVGIYVGYADGNYAVVQNFSVYLNNTAEEAPESCIACDVLPHSFTEYAYNNDQTCMQDGTETAECDYGCGTTDTKTVAGTKEPHIFTEYENTGDATATDRGTETSYCDNDCGTTDVRDVSDIYKVEASSPAIPVNTNTATKLSDLEFEIDGSVVPGADVTFALAEGVTGVTFADGVITVGADTGVFPATVTSGEKTISVYVVAKHQYDDHWYLYDEDFTKSNYNASGYGEIEIPDNWAAQYTGDVTPEREFGYTDTKYVAPYSTTSNPITEGIIPLYNFFEEKGVEVKTYGGFFTLKNEVVNSFADYTIYTKMIAYNHENDPHAGIGLFGRAETIDGKLADITAPDEIQKHDRFSAFYVNNRTKSTYSGAVSMATFGDYGYRQSVANNIAKWNNLLLAEHNSNIGEYTRLSLKYDGSKATFTNLASPKTDSVTYDLSTVTSDPDYAGNGAVGVYICRFSAGHQYPTAWFALRRFAVALNNTKYDCPLHTVITEEVDLYPGADDDQIAREPDFEELELDPPAEDLGTADSGTGAAGGSSAYLVTEAAPAIPMINTTYINFSSLVFEWDGSKVGGSTIDLIKLQEPTDGVAIDNVNKTITANKVGVYPATVIKGQYQKTVYIVVKTYNDNRWYLYDQDFTADNWNASGYGTIAVPDGWQVQYAKDAFHGGSALEGSVIPVATHIAPYSTTGNVTKGIVPFYNMYEETNNAEHNMNFGFFTLNNKIVNRFTDYTIIANTTTYNPYGEEKDGGVGLYGRVDMEPNKDGKLTDWAPHGNTWNADSFSIFYINNGTGGSSKNVYNMIIGDGAYRQKDATKLSNFGNVATTGADNNGVQLNMRLKYEGTTATFVAGNQFVEHDMSKETRYDKYCNVPGAVGFYAGMVGAADNQNTTWSAIERFSVALNNEKVDGANVNCPYFYKTANFDPGAEVEEEGSLEETKNENKKEEKVKSIKITAGFRIQYYVGEEIELNGGQITVTYTTGRKEIIDITEDMLSGFDTSKPGTYTVTITYGDKTTTFEITVVENPNVQGSAGDTNNNEPQQTVITYDYVQDFTMIIIIALAAMMLLLIIGAVVIILVAVMSKGDDDDDDLDLDDIDLDDYDLDDFDLDDYDEL